MEREDFYLTQREARNKGLTMRLELKNRNDRQVYLAEVRRPQGSTTILLAYRIEEETREGYTLAGITKKEEERLRRKYERPGKTGFTLSARTNMRN